MRRLAVHACALVAVGLAFASAGCAKSDTVLLIEISGPRTETFLPHQFRALVTAGMEPKSFDIPKVPSPSPLIPPQSFSLALDRSHTGPITVTIVALGDKQQQVGSGTTTQQHIVIGGQTVIVVALTEDQVPSDPGTGMPPDDGTGQDAGAEPSDARDGALGQDAPGDRMSLDAGTE